MDAMEEGGVLLNPEITTEMWDDIFTSSSEDEQQRISETVQLSITQAHRDPLEECMDGVEAFVHSVLKTGKVTVAGEAGGKNTSSTCSNQNGGRREWEVGAMRREVKRGKKIVGI